MLVGTVVGLVLLASAAFALGVAVGLSSPWLALAVALAVAAGAARAGLAPTVASLWLLGLWWAAFPPLVGYLGGGWPAPRYHHPRMLGFAYGSARAELLGGVEYGLALGLAFALVVGTLGYVGGAGLRRLWGRVGGDR